MYQIIEAKELTTNIYEMVVEAPRVTRNCQPGQFVIVRMDKDGERIPLTICDYDREKGTVTIVFQTVGAETTRMTSLKAGDSFYDFVGPLGRPSELIDTPKEELAKKKILFVAGGVGTAPVYPQVKWLHENGIGADVIIGAKNYDLLYPDDISLQAFYKPSLFLFHLHHDLYQGHHNNLSLPLIITSPVGNYDSFLINIP